MKMIIDIPEQIYQNAKDDMLCGSEIIVDAIKNGIPQETITEFADRCRECGARYGKLLKQKSKTGHWVPVTNGRGGHECDICHEYAPSYQSGNEYLSKRCPNCGAKMESEDKE